MNATIPKLSYGEHSDRYDDPDCPTCAREYLHLRVTGRIADKTPPGYPKWWSALPPINDMLDDEQRQRVLAPRVDRYAIPEHAERDERIRWRLVTLAVTVFAADALRAAGFAEHADKLASFGPVTMANRDAASDAAWDAAWDTARDAAWAAASAASTASAARAASDAAWAARAPANDAARERYATMILDAIDEEIAKEER